MNKIYKKMNRYWYREILKDISSRKNINNECHYKKIILIDKLISVLKYFIKTMISLFLKIQL